MSRVTQCCIAPLLALGLGLTACGNGDPAFDAGVAATLEQRVNAVKFRVASEDVVGAQDALAELTGDVTRLVDEGALDETRAAVILETVGTLDIALIRFGSSIEPTPVTTPPTTSPSQQNGEDDKGDKEEKGDKGNRENKGNRDEERDDD